MGTAECWEEGAGLINVGFYEVDSFCDECLGGGAGEGAGCSFDVPAEGLEKGRYGAALSFRISVS